MKHPIILPNYSWSASHFDSEYGDVLHGNSKEEIEAHWGGVVSAELLPLEKLIPHITDNSNWKRKFRKKSIYPPVIVDLRRRSGGWLLQGNHRVIIWKEWGFTHAPAWVIRNNKAAKTFTEVS